MTKRLVSLILLLSFLLAAFNAGGLEAFASVTDSNRDSDAFSRYILTFRQDADAEMLLADYDYSVISRSQKVYSVTAEDVSSLSSYCVYVEKDTVRELLENDTPVPSWESNCCRIPQARASAGNAKGIVIAVLDTGVDRTHKELKNANILDGFDAVTGENGVFGDDDGHGTAVISLIAAADDGVGITGVVPDATIYPVRVSSGEGNIYSSRLIAGIYNAADNGADIINISLGGYSYSVSEQRAVDYALSKGCIIIAAAGNDGADGALAGKYFYPASYEGVISVASSERDGAHARFSQFNDKVDVASLGRYVTVCSIGNDDYRTTSGTSYSCALVSGIAALSAYAADGLNGEQFEYLLISVLGSKRDHYLGYGVIDAFDTVNAAKEPIITGIYQGARLDIPPVITFNKGTARLDGRRFKSGESVTEEGVHTFRLEYDGEVRTITFTLSDEKPVYSVNKNSITYSGGNGYLDGMPYVSDSSIPDGLHTFTVKNNYSSHSVTVNIGAPAYLAGVEDGCVYKDSVAVVGYGDGVFYINEVPFTGVKVLSDGEYTATVTDTNGAVVSSVSFEVVTSRTVCNGFRYETHVYSDLSNGYLVTADDSVGSIRVYKYSNLSSPVRTLNLPGHIMGFDSDAEKLYIILENSVYSVLRAAVSGADAPEINAEPDYIPYGGYSFEENRLYFNGSPVLTTPYGNILSINGDVVYTTFGVVDIKDGSLLYAFSEEAVCISNSFALFKESGLVVFADITDIAAPIAMGITGVPSAYNKYTSSAYLSDEVEQVVLDTATDKIYLLSGGRVFYTDITFSASGILPFTDIPLYIAAGGGYLYVFFENGFCTVDSKTFEYEYYSFLSVPDKALAGYYGLAAKYGNDLVLFDGKNTVYLRDLSISDIALHADTVFVASSEGIGMFGFDGAFIGSIDSGDTPFSYTDGVYITSRDTVYLTVTGDVMGKIPHSINGVTDGLVFTDGGVYSPYGEKLSDEVYSGVFADGKNVFVSHKSIVFHGGDDTGKKPNVVGGEGIYDISTEISSDRGVLFVDGAFLEDGICTNGGVHRLECVMPFGIIFASEFSVIPALEGIAVSGGSREMSLGTSDYLLVEYLPYGASAVDAEFSVSGDSVTVNQNGFVTAVSEGVSTVTVVAGGFSASIKINVTQLAIGFSDSSIVFDAVTRTCTVPAGITAGKLNSFIVSEAHHRRFVDSDGVDIMPDSFVGTGNVIKFLSDTSEAITGITIIVKGDGDGDGLLSPADMRLLSRCISGYESGLLISSSLDCDFDGKITDSDTSALVLMINEFNIFNALPYGTPYVTASVPAVLHPVGEFSVILYVDNGKGVDSACGILEYDAEVFELLYVTGINYELVSAVDEGKVIFSAFDKDGNASARTVKTFGTARFRVKENAPLAETSFTLKNCGVTLGEQVLLSEESVKTAVVQRRTASDFSMEISNAEYFVFNPTVRNYSVTVPFDAVTLDISADYPEGGKLDISDTVIPETDELTVNIRYTSPEGVSTDYRIYVTRSAEKILANDPYLSSLSASVGDMLPEFEPERLKYKLTIPFDSSDPEFSYLTRDENTTVTVIAPESYPVGSTDVVFTCVAEDGTEISYTVTVVRKAAAEVSSTEPSEESLPQDDTENDNGGFIAAVSVCCVVAAVLIFFIIYRKGKNNVKKVK